MFADEIDTFVGALQFEFEMADNTCEAYARDLRSFTSVMAFALSLRLGSVRR